MQVFIRYLETGHNLLLYVLFPLFLLALKFHIVAVFLAPSLLFALLQRHCPISLFFVVQRPDHRPANELLNKKANEFGGFHGIIAYLLDNEANYIQAMGRVARQGKNGSFIEIFEKS